MRVILGGAILASLALHAWSKPAGQRAEMLWACYAASALLAAGILGRWPKFAAAGFLFEAAVGVPGYLLDVAASGTTTLTSLLAHAVPIAAGAIALKRDGYPRAVVLPAWCIYPAMIAISYWFTDPALNVNLAHAPWGPAADRLPALWMHWAFNLAVAALLLRLADWLLRRVFSAAPR